MNKSHTQLAPTDKQLEDFAVEEQFLLFCDVDEFTLSGYQNNKAAIKAGRAWLEGK